MKPLAMKTPALEQIYNQRYNYETHKRKLNKIYEERKSQLGYDSIRKEQFDHIKETKAKTFINKFNKNNESIAKENLKLLGKLEHAKGSLRNKSNTSFSKEDPQRRQTYSYISPFTKQRIHETEKENSRLSNRLRNISSSLNQKELGREYVKSQQIKNRLMRYTANDNKVFLKSERYLSEDGNRSVVSRDSMLKEKDQEKSQKKVVIKPKFRKSAISHYRREEILKNKVDISTSNLAGIKSKHGRPNTSINIGHQEKEDKAFFTTEPRKEKFRTFKRKV